MDIIKNVRQILKSEKLKLYEKYIFDSKGQLKLYHPVSQSLLLQVLEDAGLEDALKEYDKELQEQEAKDCE